MPKGTRVHRCVDEVKNSRRKVNPYAVCQASTKQSFATGKKLKESIAHTGYKRIGIALAETMGLVDEGIYRNWQKRRWTKKTKDAKSNLDTLQTAKEDPRTVGTTKHPRQRHIDNATNKLGKTAKKLYHHLRKDGADHTRAAQIMRHSTGGSPDPDWNPNAKEEARNKEYKAKGEKAGKEIAQKIRQEVANKNKINSGTEYKRLGRVLAEITATGVLKSAARKTPVGMADKTKVGRKALGGIKNISRAAGMVPGVGIVGDVTAGAIAASQRAGETDPERQQALNKEIAGDALAALPGVGLGTRGAQGAAKAGRVVRGSGKSTPVRRRVGAAVRHFGSKGAHAGERALTSNLRRRIAAGTEYNNSYVKKLMEAKGKTPVDAGKKYFEDRRAIDLAAEEEKNTPEAKRAAKNAKRQAARAEKRRSKEEAAKHEAIIAAKTEALKAAAKRAKEG